VQVQNAIGLKKRGGLRRRVGSLSEGRAAVIDSGGGEGEGGERRKRGGGLFPASSIAVDHSETVS